MTVASLTLKRPSSATLRRLTKTATYWVAHVSVASGLAFLLTGKAEAALAIGLLEPSIQAVVFLIHERIWEGPAAI